MRKVSWLVAVALVGFIVPAFGQDAGTKLAWKFEKDKTFYQTMKTETKQTMKVMNNDVNQTQKQTFYLSWTVADQDPQGNWVVKVKIEGVKLDITIAGTNISFDSTAANPPANNPLSDFFQSQIKHPSVLPLHGVEVLIARAQSQSVRLADDWTNPQADRKV